MAFTTEFVMGAGGSVDEIPVSMSISGGSSSSPVTYPVTTIEAGTQALIVIAGALVPSSSATLYRPHLQIGGYTHISPDITLAGPPPGEMIGGVFSGVVNISLLSRHGTGTSTFNGTVYVARL